MPPASSTRERYKRLSLSELQSLAAEGSESFTPEAWQALSEEIKSRADSAPPEVESTPTPPGASDSPTSQSLNPFVRDGVWLTIFQGMIALGTVAIGITVARALPQGLGFGTIFGGLSVLLNVFGLVLIAQRRPFARRFWVAYLGVRAVLSTGWSFDQGNLSLSVMAGIVASIAWAVYWLRSERVRLLFGDLDEGNDSR